MSIQNKSPHPVRWLSLTTIAILFVALVTVSVAGHFMLSEIRLQIAELQADVRALDSESSYRFANQSQFEMAVAESVNTMVQRRQDEDVNLRYDRYALAASKIPGGKRIYGNVDARFTLVEFSDLECPFCKRFHATPKEVVDISNGAVNWQWKHLPLSFHNPAAMQGAHTAECIAEQKGNTGFWVALEEIFRQSKGGGGGVENWADVAEAAGADLQEFNACMASGRHKEVINSDLEQATALRVNSTPATFIVDNRTGRSQLLAGAQPTQAVMAAIRKLVVEAEETTQAD